MKTQIDVVALEKFGATIRGIDLKKPFDQNAREAMCKLLARFQLLVFPEQGLSPADQLRFTQIFGQLEPGIARRPTSHQVSGHPDILYLSNKSGSPTNDYGAGWHSDGLAYAKVPHGATVLSCIACPQGAGDTLFADQYAAYEGMPTELRREIDRLSWYLPDIPFSEVPSGRGLAQPVVRTHPETLKRFVFCSPSATQIRGWSSDDSACLLKIVRSHQTRADCIYRHTWRPSDIIVWENCALLHNRADVVDFGTQGLRAMHRSATTGSFQALECEAAW